MLRSRIVPAQPSSNPARVAGDGTLRTLGWGAGTVSVNGRCDLHAGQTGVPMPPPLHEGYSIGQSSRA